MIPYSPGKWGISFAFTLSGSVFPKAFFIAFPCAVTAALLNFVFRAWLNAEVDRMGNLSGGALAGFYTVLGFLIVFRSSQAYSRWWEGLSLLQQMRGEWFNAFSSCIAFCNSAPEKQREVEEFRHYLVRLTSMLYGAALSDVSELADYTMEFFDFTGIEEESLVFLQGARFKSEIVLQWIQRHIVDAAGADVLKVAPPILSRVYNQLGNGIVLLNNAQKLNDYPVPFPVAQMIVFMLMLHWVLTAMVCAIMVDSPIWSFFQAFVVVMIYWSVHYIAQELEQPFGDDPNDLPVAAMQADLNRSLADMMAPQAINKPVFIFNVKEHTKLEMVELSLHTYPMDERVVKEHLEDRSSSQAVPSVKAAAAAMSIDNVVIDMSRKDDALGTNGHVKGPDFSAQLLGNPSSAKRPSEVEPSAAKPSPPQPDGKGGGLQPSVSCGGTSDASTSAGEPGSGLGGSTTATPEGGRRSTSRPRGAPCCPAQEVGNRMMAGQRCMPW